MSTGGYKLSKFSWIGTGTNSWYGEVGTLDEEHRLIRVLSELVETLCENSDWVMDNRTGYHASTTDYTPSSISMKTYEFYPSDGTSYTGYNKICFLTNGTLYLALGLSTGSAKLKPTDILVSVDEYTTTGNNVVYANAITGLYFSISKTGNWNISSYTYGVELPNDATKWASFGRTMGYKQSATDVYGALQNFVKDNEANVVYSYYFLTKGDHLALFEKCSLWGADTLKCIICGNLIGAFAHVTDSESLCCISLSENLYNVSTSSNGEFRGESTAPESVIGGDHYINQESNYCDRIFNSNSNTQIFRENGSSPNPYNVTTNTGVGLSVSNPIQLSNYISTPISGGTRWCPLQIYIQSNDPSSFGVISNDGFKGYLNTDLIRAITINEYALGSTFGTREFVYIGGGLIIGWGTANTESLF